MIPLKIANSDETDISPKNAVVKSYAQSSSPSSMMNPAEQVGVVKDCPPPLNHPAFVDAIETERNDRVMKNITADMMNGRFVICPLFPTIEKILLTCESRLDKHRCRKGGQGDNPE